MKNKTFYENNQNFEIKNIFSEEFKYVDKCINIYDKITKHLNMFFGFDVYFELIKLTNLTFFKAFYTHNSYSKRFY